MGYESGFALARIAASFLGFPIIPLGHSCPQQNPDPSEFLVTDIVITPRILAPGAHKCALRSHEKSVG